MEIGMKTPFVSTGEKDQAATCLLSLPKPKDCAND